MKSRGFTIVELIVVIAVIGILAAISIVSYSAIQNNAKVTTLEGDLRGASSQLESFKHSSTGTGAYAAANDCSATPVAYSICLKGSSGTTFQYTFTEVSNSFCVTATNGKLAYNVSSSDTKPVAGVCPGHTAP